MIWKTRIQLAGSGYRPFVREKVSWVSSIRRFRWNWQLLVSPPMVFCENGNIETLKSSMLKALGLNRRSLRNL